MSALPRHAQGFGHVGDGLALSTDAFDQQAAAVDSETSVTVSHEDLRFVKTAISTMPGGLLAPGSRHQRHGQVHLVVRPNLAGMRHAGGDRFRGRGPDRRDPDAAAGKGPEQPTPGDLGGHERVRDEVTRSGGHDGHDDRVLVGSVLRLARLQSVRANPTRTAR